MLGLSQQSSCVHLLHCRRTTEFMLHSKHLPPSCLRRPRAYHRNFRLFTSVLSSKRSVSYRTGPSWLLLPICSNTPLPLSRFVGVCSLSPVLWLSLGPSSSAPTGSSGRGASSYASYFRFCAVLGFCIKRRKRLSCSRRLTSSVTSTC